MTEPLCGCGRPARHMGRCGWRRRASPVAVAAVRQKVKESPPSQSSAPPPSHPSPKEEKLLGEIQSLLIKMDSVHLACIDFAHLYGQLKQKLKRSGLPISVLSLDDDRPGIVP